MQGLTPRSGIGPSPGPVSRCPRPPSVLRWLALLGILAGHSPVQAQDSAVPTVSGVVRSSGGDPIEGVRVLALRRGVEATTDPEGRFRMDLSPGPADTLAFEAEGHLPARVPLAALAAAEAVVRSVTLVPLFRLDALSVTAPRRRPLLDTEDASTGSLLPREELALLPSEARNPWTLAFGIPGVSQATGFFGDAPVLSIHGANALYTSYHLDGMSNQEGFLGGPRVEIPLGAIEELRVSTASYGVSEGRSSNGVVHVRSRSGGPEWEGEAFLVRRPGIPFDARPAFAPEGVDPEGFRRTQTGASLGGPLIRGRSFLLLAVEGVREREERIGSTALTPFLGVEERETGKGFVRLDHGWDDRRTTTLVLAGSDVRRAGLGGGVILPEADITTVRRGTIAALTHRQAGRDGRSANTLSLQLAGYRWDFPPTEGGVPLPQVTVVGPDRTTVQGVVGSSNFVFDEREVQFQLRNVLEHYLGDRGWVRAGVDLSRSTFRLRASATNPLGSWTVVNEGNIRPAGPLLSFRDIPADVRVLRYSVDLAPQQVDRSQLLAAAFVGGAWRLTPSLRVEGGVRWDYDDLTARGPSRPDLDNVQPRLSATWFADPRTVVRGGWGWYTGVFPYAVYSDAVQFGPNGNAVVTWEEGSSFLPPRWLDPPPADGAGFLRSGLPPREVRAMFARGLEQPTSMQLTLGVQRELAPGWGITMDGVWSETRGLPRSWDLNAIGRMLLPGDTIDRPAGFGDPYRPIRPAPGGVRRWTTTDSGGRARYLGLQTTLRGGVGDRLALEGSWTWSRARNDTEDINFHAASGNDFRSEWADAVNDRRHHVSLRATGAPHRALHLSGMLDWQTGTPFNRIAGFRDLDGSGPIFGNGFIGNHDRFPGVPRNGERLPDALAVHASAGWEAPWAGGRTGLRIEVFNLFNRTNVSGFAQGIPGGGPRTQVGRPGDPVDFRHAAPPRQFQLSIHHAF